MTTKKKVLLISGLVWTGIAIAEFVNNGDFFRASIIAMAHLGWGLEIEP